MDRLSRAFFVSVISVTLASLAIVSSACGGNDGNTSPDADPGGDAPIVSNWVPGPNLPSAIANNAVAGVETAAGCDLFSALGIAEGFANTDISNASYRWRAGEAAWTTIADAPGPPRVAANAVGLAGNFYLLGGYTVADNGAEASGTTLDMFNVSTGAWESKAPIPTAIDDTVMLSWLDRYIVVVSGWSNTANVSAVQIYDAQLDAWQLGTPFPGTPAFGHAGGIDGNTLVVIDGAASTSGFPIVNQSWRGELDPNNVGTIVWTDLGPHPGPARYRAAGGRLGDGRIVFHGGTATPYNFDGLRYDNNQAAAPLATTLVYSAETNALTVAATEKPSATMDHRSLASCGSNRAYLIGGMVAGPTATPEVWLLQGDLQ